MAVAPVRNSPGGVQRELLTNDRPVAAVQAAEPSRFTRKDRFDRSADRAEAEAAAVQDRKLHERLKAIAERRDAADRAGMLPKASMFVPLPEAWTPSGVNSKG